MEARIDDDDMRRQVGWSHVVVSRIQTTCECVVVRVKEASVVVEMHDLAGCFPVQYAEVYKRSGLREGSVFYMNATRTYHESQK